MRGVPEENISGFTLVEAAQDEPDATVADLVLTAPDLASPQSVFVCVNAKGDEDWLSLGVITNNLNPEVTYFKQPLADFATNQWYEVVVPAALLKAGTNQLTYFLHSAGPTNSSVFVGLGITEVFSPVVSALAATNNQLILRLENLIPMANYELQHSASLTNWQTLTNLMPDITVDSLSTPVTNMATFYRLLMP